MRCRTHIISLLWLVAELNPELGQSPSVTLLGSVSGKKETDPLLAAFSELILRLKARMQIGFTIQGAQGYRV